MINDLPIGHVVKESGFESSFVWIRQNLVSYCLYFHTLHYNTFQLLKRALLIMAPLSSCLLLSGSSLPFLQWSGPAVKIPLCRLVLQQLLPNSGCSLLWPLTSAGFCCSASLCSPRLHDQLLSYERICLLSVYPALSTKQVFVCLTFSIIFIHCFQHTVPNASYMSVSVLDRGTKYDQATPRR